MKRIFSSYFYSRLHVLIAASAMTLSSHGTAIEAPITLQEDSHPVAFNLKAEHVAKELIVTWNPSVVKSAYLATMMSKYAAKTVQTYRSSPSQLIRFENVTEDRLLQDVAEQLSRLPEVRSVEANTIMQGESLGSDFNTTATDDPAFIRQYGLHNTGQVVTNPSGGNSTGLFDADIDAPEAWQITTGNKRVLVGVISSGIDYNHRDLEFNYWRNPGETGLDANGLDKSTNGLDDDHNGYIDDFRGWNFLNNNNDPVDTVYTGTMIAGVIGAKANNQRGISGVNWDVSLVALKVVDSQDITLDSLLRATEYGIAIGVDVMMNHWQSRYYSRVMSLAIQEAGRRNIVYVTGAGDSDSNVDTKRFYPAFLDHENMMTVTSSDCVDKRGLKSNWGTRIVHLAAPGQSIYSTSSGGGYMALNSSFLAAAHVAGAVALVKSQYPSASVFQLRNRVLNHVDRLTQFEQLVMTGGRLNVFNALVSDEVSPSQVEDVSLVNVKLESAQFSWAAAGDDGVVGQSTGYLMRVSDHPIDSEDDWNAATPVRSEISKIENRYQGLVRFRTLNSSGFLAVRAYDDVGNEGPISGSVYFATPLHKLVYKRKADTMDGFTAEEKWGLQSTDGILAYSDSPNGSYDPHKTSSLIMTNDIHVSKSSALFVMNIRLEFAYRTDKLYVDVSLDAGSTWVPFTSVTEFYDDFVNITAPIPRIPESGANIRLRFRLVPNERGLVGNGVEIREFAVYESDDSK